MKRHFQVPFGALCRALEPARAVLDPARTRPLSTVWFGDHRSGCLYEDDICPSPALLEVGRTVVLYSLVW